MKRAVLIFLVGLFAVWGGVACAAELSKDEFLVLCYHDIPKEVHFDDYGVDQESFVQQLEYLHTHGYHFISVDDIINAHEGRKPLPEKAVLLTFDDGYLSFYESVFPLLKLYRYPCVLAVETRWVGEPDPDIKAPLMNWEQLKEVAKSKLVEIASHTHDLHHGVIYNPQGNNNWAAVARIYDPKTKTYESEGAYRMRIRDDLTLSKKLLQDKLGVNARAMVWPYGEYNQICIEEAKSLGFELMFYLEDKPANINNIYEIPRYVYIKNPDIAEFIKRLNNNFIEDNRERVLHADLDLLYDPDAVQQEKNLDQFVERVYNMKVSTVYLQAFCDNKGDGNISSVYFPNHVLPMRADLFNRAVNQLAIRGIKVYAWMPMLSIVLPDAKENNSLRLMEYKDGRKSFPDSGADPWYDARLSPFSQEVRNKLKMLYEDMAVNARIDGVVFLDDGYLNDFEDFSPYGMSEYLKISGGRDIPYNELSKEAKEKWTRRKTSALIELTEELKSVVRYYRPQALFARTLYAEVLLEPESEEWYAQNFSDSLKAYDYVVIMAYPLMEKVKHPLQWLKSLVQEARKYPQGIQKTVFKIQTYDWDSKCWVDNKTVNSWLRTLIAEGAVHVGYYPDNFIENQPDERQIRFVMSTEDFPFKRKYVIKDLTLVK